MWAATEILILYKSMKQCLTLDKLNTVFLHLLDVQVQVNTRINSIGRYTFFCIKHAYFYIGIFSSINGER
ncbi:hypothetical protein J2Z65_002245 [Paenibacillus aceris]|uniref:Uncharacterized protein n=1 Tax=Paenibacillus aceris TaxID=869555 RepID=A0ABS4HWK2_9BACL|nr:hypothetical protein [Paenibacillus aceris]